MIAKNVIQDNEFEENEQKQEKIDMVPNDPMMLLSYVNLKLRDFYGSLDALCEDMDLDKAEIIDKLAGINYHYDGERNQFV